MAVLYKECYDIFVDKKCIAKEVLKRYVADFVHQVAESYGDHLDDGPANEFEVTLKRHLVKVEVNGND